MKLIKFTPLLLVLMLTITSCNSVRVASDYDKNADFNQYKTYAFFKSGIDKVEISDLDKRRILAAIDSELSLKGLSKNENPDLLINIFTKSRQQIDVNQFNYGYGFGWGYSPWMWGGRNTSVSTSTEGTLYIDVIDAKKKELIWQGEGIGILSQNMNNKDKRIQEFVEKILAKYPPESK